MAHLCRPRRHEIKGGLQSFYSSMHHKCWGGSGRLPYCRVKGEWPILHNAGAEGTSTRICKDIQSWGRKSQGQDQAGPVLDTRHHGLFRQAHPPMGGLAFTMTPGLQHRINKDSSHRLERFSAAFLPLEKEPWSQGLCSGLDAAPRLEWLAPHPKR